MEPRNTNDYGDYAECYEKVDPARRVVAEKYITELLFMERQLAILKEDIESNGAVDNFTQGRQSMLRESPAMKSYCTLVQRFGDLQKKLADILPEKREAQQEMASEQLTAFLAKGKGKR